MLHDAREKKKRKTFISMKVFLTCCYNFVKIS